MTDMHDGMPHDSITSPANPRLRQAAALRSSDARRDTGLTLVDGRREISLAIAAGIPLVELFVAAELLARDDPRGPADTLRSHEPLEPWLRSVAARGTRVTLLGPRAFERVAFGSRNEGVVGVVRFGPQPLDRAALAGERPVLILIDELSIYLRKIKGPAAGQAAEQLTPFLTDLIKAVNSSPQAVLVFTLSLGKGGQAVDAAVDLGQDAVDAATEFGEEAIAEVRALAARRGPSTNWRPGAVAWSGVRRAVAFKSSRRRNRESGQKRS